MISGDLPLPPVARLIGFRPIAAEVGKVTLQMETALERHASPLGTVHGGIICDLADAAMGLSYVTTLAEGESFTTLELKINFLRPVWQTTLTAEGTVVQRGKTVGMTECSVYDPNRRLIAKATSTCLTLRGDQAKGR